MSDFEPGQVVEIVQPPEAPDSQDLYPLIPGDRGIVRQVGEDGVPHVDFGSAGTYRVTGVALRPYSPPHVQTLDESYSGWLGEHPAIPHTSVRPDFHEGTIYAMSTDPADLPEHVRAALGIDASGRVALTPEQEAARARHEAEFAELSDRVNRQIQQHERSQTSRLIEAESGPPAEHAVGPPQRDDTVPPDTGRGLYRKYVVRRTDGRDVQGQKHEDCRLFILDIDHDVHAKAALSAYAESCHAEYPDLAADLRKALLDRQHWM